MQKNKLLTVNNKMCQMGSRKCAADCIDIDQLHYCDAGCPFWVLYYISMVKMLWVCAFIQSPMQCMCHFFTCHLA